MLILRKRLFGGNFLSFSNFGLTKYLFRVKNVFDTLIACSCSIFFVDKIVL